VSSGWVVHSSSRNNEQRTMNNELSGSLTSQYADAWDT